MAKYDINLFPGRRMGAGFRGGGWGMLLLSSWNGLSGLCWCIHFVVRLRWFLLWMLSPVCRTFLKIDSPQGVHHRTLGDACSEYRFGAGFLHPVGEQSVARYSLLHCCGWSIGMVQQASKRVQVWSRVSSLRACRRAVSSTALLWIDWNGATIMTA